MASERKLSPNLKVPPKRSRPGDALDTDTRWAIIAKLLRDPDIEVADRVAGSFVLLYAQPLSCVAVMSVDAITTTDTDISVRFGTQAIVVPEPLATQSTPSSPPVAPTTSASARPRPVAGCFPAISPDDRSPPPGSGQRLSHFGIDARAARRAAQQHLAAQVPAVVLAEMLGVTINTAVDWVHAAGGDWANYAAATATDTDNA